VGSRAAALRRVLATPGLRRLELAFLGFGAAEYGVWVTVLVYAYQRGGTPTAATIAVVQLVPAAIVAPLAARLVDRRGGAVMIRIGYVAQAGAMGLTATSVVLGAPAVVVYAGAVLAASAVTMTRPAQAAVLPGLVDQPAELTAANVVSGWVESVSMLIGPALAGVMIDLGGPGASIGLFAVVVCGSAVLVGGLPDATRPQRTVVGSDAPRADPSLVRMLGREPGLAALIAILGLEFVAIGAVDVLVVVLALKVLALGASGAGYLAASFGAGAVLGGVVAVSLVGGRLVAALVGAALAWGAAFLALGAWPTVGGAFFLLAGAGACRTVLDVSGRAILQRGVPVDGLGRIFGVLEGVAMIGLAVGSISVPVLVAIGGAAAPLVGLGALLVVGVLAAASALTPLERGAPAVEVELALLRGSPIFGMLAPPVLEGLARALIARSVTPGEVVVREGDAGNHYYLVGDGDLAVSLGGREVGRLGPGDGFGELALLDGGIRKATVAARGSATIYALAREPFLEAVTRSHHARQAAERLVGEFKPDP
jgi:hypothetical protein